MEKNDKRIDDIISMLDKFTVNNGGHMNITVNEDSIEKQVDTANSLDCSNGDMACKVPTLFEGIEDNE